MSFRKRTAKERFFEVIPGTMFWATFVFAIFFSSSHPVWVATFIILFDLYWLLKAINTAAHLATSYGTYHLLSKIDWFDYLSRLNDLEAYTVFLSEKYVQSRSIARNFFNQEKLRIQQLIARRGNVNMLYDDIYHIVLFPFVNENFEVLEASINAVHTAKYSKDKLIILLASEERAGAVAAETAAKLKEKFATHFYKFFVTVHPDGLAGEIRGKSANASWAVKSILPELEKLHIPIDNVLVSNFDSDTVVHPQYFARVSYEFMTVEKPYRCSYQPIALYNNNIWDSPAFVRIVSVTTTFFQFVESSRIDRLRTFSSHSMSLRALVDVGFWRKDLINEDGYIFWQCYLHYNGDYQVLPLYISISLDTCLAETFWKTLINQYKQRRRWAYNVEYYPSLIPALIKVQSSFWDKTYKLYQYVEGNYNWAAAPIIILVVGWLPLIFGGNNFGHTVIALNLPIVTKTLMTMATASLIFSVYINMYLLPPRPKKYSAWKNIAMYLQWIFVPFTTVIFSSFPAIEAQTRLMVGAYMEFWVTPKVRKGEVAEMAN